MSIPANWRETYDGLEDANGNCVSVNHGRFWNVLVWFANGPDQGHYMHEADNREHAYSLRSSLASQISSGSYRPDPSIKCESF